MFLHCSCIAEYNYLLVNAHNSNTDSDMTNLATLQKVICSFLDKSYSFIIFRLHHIKPPYIEEEINLSLYRVMTFLYDISKYINTM